MEEIGHRLLRSSLRHPLAVVLVALLSLAAVALAAGCGEDAVGSGAAVYTEADSGSSVTAAVGDTVIIRLSENPSTGYAWDASSSDGLQQLESSLVVPSASPAVVGAAGTREIRYEVRQSGRQTVEATYARSWETGESGTAGEFTLTIDVE